jgi:hypothetical protein
MLKTAGFKNVREVWQKGSGVIIISENRWRQSMDIIYKEHELTADEFLKFEKQMGGVDETTLQQAERAFANQICSVAAFYGSEVIGIGRLIGDASIYWILTEIWVLPEFQHKGVGKNDKQLS